MLTLKLKLDLWQDWRQFGGLQTVIPLLLQQGTAALLVVIEDVAPVVVLGGPPVAHRLHVRGHLREDRVGEDRRAGEVVQDELQDEALPAGHDDAVQLGPVDFPQQQHLGEGGREESEGSEEDSQAGDGQHGHPPHPEGEEVLLVEEVVAQDTEVVLIE